MAIKTYSGAAGVEAGVPNTKLRAEQMKSEDSFTSLAVDLEALRGQIKGIIGSDDYKEEITGEYAKVQIVDLAAHLDASGGASLSVKQAANVVGAFSVNTDKLTVAAATGNTAIKGTLDVDGQATLAPALVENMTTTDGALVFHNASKVLGDNANLKFDGSDLFVPGLKDSSLTATHVVFAGTSGELVGEAAFVYNAGSNVLSISGSQFGQNVTVGQDLTVTGDFKVMGALTYLDTQNLMVKDAKIVISSGSLVDAAGIYLGSEDAGENIRWNLADTKWIASDKFAADTLQALDLSDAIVWADASGNLVEISNQQLADAIEARLVAGTGVSISETGAAITVAIGQPVATTDSVTFAAVTGSNLTASRLMASNGSKGMVSADLFAWVAGTANRISVADDADGTITLSAPQDIHSGSSPEFAALNLAAYGDLLAVGSNFKVSATAELLFGDSYQAGSTFSTALKLAGSSDEWSKIESAYGAEKTLLGMLADAAPATNKRLVKVGAPMGSAGPDFFITAADIGGAFPTGAVKYQGGLADVYVNGQKQVEGVSADFEFQDIISGTDKVKVAFKYNLQIGDVVEVIRYPAAAK